MNYEEINNYVEEILRKYDDNFKKEFEESIKSVSRLMYSKGFTAGRFRAREERIKEIDLYYDRLLEEINRKSLSLLTYKESLVLAYFLIGEVFNCYKRREVE